MPRRTALTAQAHKSTQQLIDDALNDPDITIVNEHKFRCSCWCASLVRTFRLALALPSQWLESRFYHSGTDERSRGRGNSFLVMHLAANYHLSNKKRMLRAAACDAVLALALATHPRLGVESEAAKLAGHAELFELIVMRIMDP